MGQMHLRDQKIIGAEDLLDRTLRWMRENLDGANRAVHPAGHSNEGKPCSNSGTAIIVCCYINVLGRVLKKGKGRDNERFKFFVTECMTDFMNAASTKALPARAGLGAGAGDAWLYHVYRCGFVHEFYAKQSAWTRSTSARYWLKYDPVTLNINGLVKGFYKGVEEFKKKAAADPDLRAKFKAYITA